MATGLPVDLFLTFGVHTTLKGSAVSLIWRDMMLSLITKPPVMALIVALTVALFVADGNFEPFTNYGENAQVEKIMNELP